MHDCPGFTDDLSCDVRFASRPLRLVSSLIQTGRELKSPVFLSSLRVSVIHTHK